jgi:hypothetical protein
MSKVTYRYEYSVRQKEGDKSNLHKEELTDGEYLSFSLTSKNGDEFHKITVKEEKGVFKLTEKKNDKESSKDLDEKALKEFVKKNKLDFVADYLKKRDKVMSGGALIGTQNGGKKGSKKSSVTGVKKCKTSKKGSKKSSKKGSKKSSKKKSKGGKKSSKKGSKKSSNKKSNKVSTEVNKCKSSKKGSKKSKK